MNSPRGQAYNLFFNTNLTQKQIAEHIGVNPKTLYEWMKEGNWKTLKATSRLMPAQIVDDIYNHITHLNYSIKSRDFEQRYPSKDEAETLRKLIFSIPKVKLNVSKGESAQSMMNFLSWLTQRNQDAAIFVSQFIDEYLHSPRQQGFETYDFEYDADQYYNPTESPTPLASLRGTKQSHDNTGKEAEPSAAGQSSPPYFQGGVPAKPSAAPAGGSGSPLAPGNTSLQGEELQAPSLFLGKVPEGGKGNLAQDTPPDSLENQAQTGPRSGALSTSISTAQNPAHQSTSTQNPNISTPGNKNAENGGNNGLISDEEVQEIFASWQKVIEKERRRRRR